MENDNYKLIKEIIIINPPTHYDVPYKNPKYDKNGKLVEKIRYYLTGNLFYSDAGSIHTVRKIVQETKEYLFSYLKGIPPLDKMRFDFEYHRNTKIDLDNKFSFWGKILLDILKTPTEKEINRALKFKRRVITTNTVPDDNSNHVDGFNVKFVPGEHKMVIRIYGRVKDEQKTLDLF